MPVASSINERNGMSLRTYWIPSTKERQIAFFVTAVAGGSGSVTNAPLTNRKLMASTKNAQARPGGTDAHESATARGFEEPHAAAPDQCRAGRKKSRRPRR